jgi:hypothetical protein
MIIPLPAFAHQHCLLLLFLLLYTECQCLMSVNVCRTLAGTTLLDSTAAASSAMHPNGMAGYSSSHAILGWTAVRWQQRLEQRLIRIMHSSCQCVEVCSTVC